MYYFPVLSLILKDKYGLKVGESSLYFIIETLGFFIFLKPLEFLHKKFDYKVVICLGFLISALGNLLLSENILLPQ